MIVILLELANDCTCHLAAPVAYDNRSTGNLSLLHPCQNAAVHIAIPERLQKDQKVFDRIA